MIIESLKAANYIILIDLYLPIDTTKDRPFRQPNYINSENSRQAIYLSTQLLFLIFNLNLVPVYLYCDR